MQDPEQIRKELERRGQQEKLRRLAAAMDLEQARRALRSGDSAQLGRVLQTILSSREGRELAESVKKMMDK